MKRSLQEVSGHPKSRNRKRDVAGSPGSKGRTQVASFLHFAPDSPGRRATDAALIDDFADFLAAGAGADAAPLPEADREFVEKLRRRLWRDFVRSNLRGGTERH